MDPEYNTRECSLKWHAATRYFRTCCSYCISRAAFITQCSFLAWRLIEGSVENTFSKKKFLAPAATETDHTGPPNIQTCHIVMFTHWIYPCYLFTRQSCFACWRGFPEENMEQGLQFSDKPLSLSVSQRERSGHTEVTVHDPTDLEKWCCVWGECVSVHEREIETVC